jgi:protein translocase SecG subunit
MLQITWVICSCVLVFIILIRIPQKDGSSQNFNLSSGFLGSPKNTDQTLQNFIWFLSFSFLILSGFRAAQTF